MNEYRLLVVATTLFTLWTGSTWAQLDDVEQGVQNDTQSQVYITIKNANILYAPSTKVGRVTTLHIGTQVAVLAQVQDEKWSQVLLDGKMLGFIYSPLLNSSEEYLAYPTFLAPFVVVGEWDRTILSANQSATTVAAAPVLTPPALETQEIRGNSESASLDYWAEEAFWEAVKDSTKPFDFEAYLDTYPQGRYVEQAKQRLASLHETATPTRAIPEALDFQIHYLYRHGGQGEPQSFQSGSMLHSGDHYKIQFTPDEDCYVYILQIDSSETLYKLFPLEKFGDVKLNHRNPVKAGATYTVPGPNQWFELDDQVGDETIYFLASRQPKLHLENLADTLDLARAEGDVALDKSTQLRLGHQLKKRGPARIVTDTDTQTTVQWSPGVELKAPQQRLEDVCERCAGQLRFRHQ